MSVGAHPQQHFDPAAELGVMTVLPHPDDETFSSGGTLLHCADAGTRTLVLCGTYGDMGRRMGRPPVAHRESLRDVRERELEEACAILGSELQMLGLRDKCVEFEDPHEIAARVRTVIETWRPSSVITFYPGYGVHADHDALGWITQLAVRGMDEAHRPRLLAVAVGDRDANVAALGEPDVRCDILAVADRKIAALKAHRSQTEAMFARFESDAGDEQAKAFQERIERGEQFYVLSPDLITDYERRRT